jgi:ribosome-associated protein
MNVDLLHQSIHSAAQLSYSRSGGPGGQNVNKVNSKVTLRLCLDDLTGLSAPEIARVRELLAGRINAKNEIIIISEEERSQRTNQERAFSRLEALLRSSARLPKCRRPTKPSRASREKRLQSKKLHGLKKTLRHKQFPD